MPFDLCSFDIKKYNKLLKNGLSNGLTDAGGRMCIEAVICEVMGENPEMDEESSIFNDRELNDHPSCVTPDIADFKITLNDSNWSSEINRAKGLYKLGLAQLGSKGKITGKQFDDKLLQKFCQLFMPHYIKTLYKDNKFAIAAIPIFQNTKLIGTSLENLLGDASGLFDKYPNEVFTYPETDSIIKLIDEMDSPKSDRDYYLKWCAKLALLTLEELGSPGCKLYQTKKKNKH